MLSTRALVHVPYLSLNVRCMFAARLASGGFAVSGTVKKSIEKQGEKEWEKSFAKKKKRKILAHKSRVLSKVSMRDSSSW